MMGRHGDPMTNLDRELLEVIAEIEAELTLPQKAAVWSGMIGIFVGAATENLGITESEALAWVLARVRERIQAAKKDPRLKAPSRGH